VTELHSLDNKQAFRTHAGRLLFLGVLALSSHAQAELYKWTDGQGKVNYSDQPPSVNAQTIKASPAGQAETTTQATQALDAQDQAYQKRLKDAEDARVKADKEAEQARVQRENCDKARNNLSTLQNTPRVYTTNPAGQRVYMDDTARANALASSQKAVSDFCK
jgi:Domain of unknown function (DUF4124)